MVDLAELLKEPVLSVIKREQTTLERLVNQCRGRVVLFGAGNLGRRALAEMRGIGVEPLCISDNNRQRWGESIEGCPILCPTEAAERYGSDSLFIVTIWNAAHWFVETQAQLEGLGCSLISSYSPLYWRFGNTFLPFLLNDYPHRVFDDASNALAAEGLWVNPESLATYRSLVYWYATGDASRLPGRPNDNSYFLGDVFSISPDEVFVDCGAFDGDTVRQFTNLAGTSFKALHAIEADPLSLDKLKTALGKMPIGMSEKIVVHPCAIGAERASVRFEITGTVDSKVCAEGGIKVECFPLDEMFAEIRLTFIKMDIEGAEFDALRGARKVIQRDRPILAICVYHKQSDIWRIPLLVKEMVPDYGFYLRACEGDGFQTVMYAVPPERRL
jgi:FkbM family methyltransferase